jgi:hypothetical protein
MEAPDRSSTTRLPTIYDADFDLRVMAREKINAGLLPHSRVAGDLLQGYSGHLEPCVLCDQNIASDDPWVRLVYSNPRYPDSQLHELCYLAWCAEVLEG